MTPEKKEHTQSPHIDPIAQEMLNNPSARPKMVGWYNPGQLIVTGLKTALSTLFGSYADFRLLEAFKLDKFYDYSKQTSTGAEYTSTYLDLSNMVVGEEREEIWIDYVSDLGDGFNSTYTIAHYAAQPTLSLPDWETGKVHETSRGNILIFGGDEVYPTASRKGYLTRLFAPYSLALRRTEDSHPHLFAVPGNHDWYDGLVTFTRFFCSRKWFNGWICPQDKSYFAIKLPYGWWILGTDVQLNSDIDAQQVEYFKAVAQNMQEGERVILCNAEPYWVNSHKYSKYDPTYNETNLAYLEKIFDNRIQIFLAGDDHHYRRFEYVPTYANGTPDHSQKIEKITAGGGGAFLHPTHDMKERFIQDDPSKVQTDGTVRKFDRKKDFPSEKQSRAIGWGNFLFLFKNRWFGIVTAFLYLFTSLSIFHLKTTTIPHDFNQFLKQSLISAVTSGHALVWILVILAGFWLFTDTHSKRYKWIAGSIHGLTHVVAMFFISCGTVYLVGEVWGLAPGFGATLATELLIFAGGWIVGSIIMGLYLFISLNIFGRHSNEAFSSLHVEDWKNFLRIHLDKAGNLTIYPIGVERIIRHWKAVPKSTPMLIPTDKDTNDPRTKPKLIESPIVITSLDKK